MRRVFALGDLQPPVEITLDTSFVVSALSAAEPHHRESLGFLQAIVESQSLVVYSRLLEVELVEVAFRIAIRERFGSNRVREQRQDGRVRRRAARLADNLVNSWRDVRDVVPTLCIDLDEIIDDVPSAMRDWGLESYDAVHAVTARYAGADSIATLNAGFGQVPASQLAVYTNRSRVSAVRRHRGGRGSARR